MAGRTTLFMTPEESERVNKKFQHGVAQCKKRAGEKWKSEDRKGLIQHATSTSLMQELSLASLGFGAPQKKSDDTMMTYAIGREYTPCVAATKDLAPMKVSELELETHHRGKKLAVRRISPVAELKANSWTVVEGLGEEPDHVVIVEANLHKHWLGKDLLDSGAEYIIREPFYTLNNDNEAVVRISHPSDLHITAMSEDPECWRDNYTIADGDKVVTPAQCKESGNAALGKQLFSLAHGYYTRGIVAADANPEAAGTLPKDIRRNRAHVNLILQRYDEALSDALGSLTNGTTEEEQSLDSKAYFRAGSAAYALGQFEDAKKYFEEQERLHPDNKTSKINIKRTTKRIEETAKGNHDMKKIAAALPKTQWRADVADYFGNTEVKDSPGAGHGLFATRDFKPGELIMVEKAFCIVSSKDKPVAAKSALTVDVNDNFLIRVFPAGLCRAVVQKLLNNPSLAPRILCLDSGTYAGLGDAPVSTPEGPALDVFQVHHIVQRNAFGLDAYADDEDVTNATTGLWARASFLNHACVCNAEKSFTGDIMVVRATEAIRAGEEITHSYDANGDYDARMAALQRTWGFRCRCRLCKVEASDSKVTRQTRREREKEANEFAQGNNPNGARIVAVSKAKRLRKAILDTYDEKRYKGLPTLATTVIDHWLAAAQRSS